MVTASGNQRFSTFSSSFAQKVLLWASGSFLGSLFIERFVSPDAGGTSGGDRSHDVCIGKSEFAGCRQPITVRDIVEGDPIENHAFLQHPTQDMDIILLYMSKLLHRGLRAVPKGTFG